jgi:hypothetical protein
MRTKSEVTERNELTEADLEAVSGGWGIAPGLFAQKATPQQQGKSDEPPQDTVSFAFGEVTKIYSPQ